MKKLKLLAIMLIIPLVLSLAACNLNIAKKGGDDQGSTDVADIPDGTDKAGKNSYQLYKSSLDKTNSLTDVSTTQCVDADMSITIAGMTYNMQTVTNTASKIKNLLKPDMLIEIHQDQKVIALGNSENTKMDFFVDKDNIYVSQDGDPFITVNRSSAEAQAFNESIESLTSDSSASELTQDMFVNSRISTASDGTRTITLALTNSQLMKLVGDNIESALATMDSIGAENINYDFDNIIVSISIDPNGYLSMLLVNCDMDMDMSVQGQKASSTTKLKTTTAYVDIGKAVSIVMPTN